MFVLFATAFVTISLVEAMIPTDQVRERLSSIERLNYPIEFENVDANLSILEERYPGIFNRFVGGVSAVMEHNRVPGLFVMANAFRLVSMFDPANEGNEHIVAAISLVSTNMVLITQADTNPDGRTVLFVIHKYLDNWGTLYRSLDSEQKDRVRSVFVEQGLWVSVYAPEETISAIYSNRRDELLRALSLQPEVFEERFEMNKEVPHGPELKYWGRKLLNSYNNPRLRCVTTGMPSEDSNGITTEEPDVGTTTPWLNRFPVLSFVIHKYWDAK